MDNGSQLPRNSLRNLMRRVWRTLGSTRLAAILLAVFLLAALLAAIVPQMPADPAAHEAWLAAVRLRYRGSTDLLYAVGLFDAYHAPWFVALLAALLLNTLLCTLQRLPRLWRALSGPPLIARPEAFFAGAARRAEWPVPSLQAGLAAAREVLSRRRYRTYTEHDQVASVAHLYAEQGQWAQAGTVVSHTAGLLLLLALLARPALAWQESGVVLLPGQTYAPDRGSRPGVWDSRLAVQAGPLAIDRYPDGQPRDYRVPLAILADGSPPKTRIVRINHPLTVRGIHFHFQGYGPAAQVMAPEDTFDLAFAEGGAQEVELPQAGLGLRLAYQPEAAPVAGGGEGTLFVEARTADGALLGSGSVADGDQIEVQGTTLTFHLGHYTTWQISRDPTFALALVAAGALLAGMVVSLWVPQRRLWLRVDGQATRLAGSGDLDGELGALAETVAGAWSGANDSAREPEEEAGGR